MVISWNPWSTNDSSEPPILVAETVLIFAPMVVPGGVTAETLGVKVSNCKFLVILIADPPSFFLMLIQSNIQLD